MTRTRRRRYPDTRCQLPGQTSPAGAGLVCTHCLNTAWVCQEEVASHGGTLPGKHPAWTRERYMLETVVGSSALSLPAPRSSPWAVDFELNLHPAWLGLQGHVTEFMSRQELRSTGGNCQGDDRQESCSSAGNCQADEQTVITQLSRP